MDWHAQPASRVCETLASRPSGLTDEETRRALEKYGPNRLPPPPRRSPVLRFLDQFNNTLIYFLLAAAVAAAAMGHVVDAVVIVLVVTVNAIVGFVQEGKAEQALAAIGEMIAPMACVLRGGARQHLPAQDIVPGDIVLLEAGDRVPADLRLLRVRGLLVDEAILTGESVPAQKQEDVVAADAALGDRLCMAYSGTIVMAGQGTGLVVATGAQTEIGRISRMIAEVRTLQTPLLRQINRFGRIFTWLAIGAAALLLAFAMLVRAYAWDEALMVVVALAVGVVPEGLPAVITITLAIGVRRMAGRNAIVRRLPAVETLGATSVICSDKTGTLTRNEMMARRVIVDGAQMTVSGTGYDPAGELRGEPSAAEMLATAGLLCNDAQLRDAAGGWQVLGDPMEGALIALAIKTDPALAARRSDWRRLDEIPFDAAHRFMATLHETPTGERYIFVKGAPERVLAMCDRQRGAAGEEAPLRPDMWEAGISEAAAAGERVLGFAMRQLSGPAERLSFSDVETGMVFLGLVGFIDPPREEAIAAVAECRSAGITVKMITGDHAKTAAAIARQLRLADDPQVMTGAALDDVPDDELAACVRDVSVFARTSPEHKLRIVRALQANGAVVAMTGDGVNDAPSLKQADVGIAMGGKGTEAAKQAAEMVLVDDNFASIVAAVYEGRTVYDNIRKVISWTLPTNGGEALCVIIALMMGAALPMTPVQILWINMVLTVTLGLVLAFEPPEPGVMKRPPRPPRAPILSRFLVWRVVFVSLLFTVGVFSIWEYAMWREYGEGLARTMVVNAVVVMEIFYLFNVRYLHMTSFSLRGAMGTPAVLWAIGAVVAAQLLFTYFPPMQAIFDTAAVSLTDGVLIVLVGVVLMCVLEGEKILMRKTHLSRQQ